MEKLQNNIKNSLVLLVLGSLSPCISMDYLPRKYRTHLAIGGSLISRRTVHQCPNVKG
jgi:hypothetical protein